MRRWFYIDIRKAWTLLLIGKKQSSVFLDRVIHTDFGQEVVLDLSEPLLEYKNSMYPMMQIFDGGDWQDDFDDAWPADEHKLHQNPEWETDARRHDMNHFMARHIFCFLRKTRTSS